jgi:nucleotide-binding universal stress UspA family protein
MINKIAVGSDGSPHGQHAVEFAAQLAAQLDAEVVLIHVPEMFPPALAAAGGYAASVPQEIIDEERRDVERRVHAEFAKPLTERGIRWSAEIAQGWPPDAIANTARDLGADLIIVGTRGLHALGELFLGSTSHALVQRAPVPVLVVPGPHASKATNGKKVREAVAAS